MKITGPKRKIAKLTTKVKMIATGGTMQRTIVNPMNNPAYLRKSLKLNKRSFKLESSSGSSSTVCLLNLISKIITK